MEKGNDLSQVLMGIKPPAPAEYIREDILNFHGISKSELARRLKVSRRAANEIANGDRGISVFMARRLAALTKTSPEMWLRLQMMQDLSEPADDPELEDIKPLSLS